MKKAQDFVDMISKNSEIELELETKELWLRAKIALQYRELRKKLRLTQKDVALRMGVSVQQIAKFENMVNSPTLTFLVKYAIALETEIDVMLRGVNLVDAGESEC
jgi:transcriptional regulator with XRE-family HTH domain